MADKDKYPGADAFGAAFEEAVGSDKDLQSAPVGDKMREDPPEMINRPEPPSEEVNTLREAAQRADEAAKDEFSESWKGTKDVQPPKKDKPPEFGSFREAFAWHRANGDKTFDWTSKDGKQGTYSTELAPAKKAAAAVKPAEYGNEGKRMVAEPVARKPAGSIYDTSRDPLVQKVKAMASSVGSKTGADPEARMPAPQRRGLPMSEKRGPLSLEGVDPKTLLPRSRT